MSWLRIYDTRSHWWTNTLSEIHCAMYTILAPDPLPQTRLASRCSLPNGEAGKTQTQTHKPPRSGYRGWPQCNPKPLGSGQNKITLNNVKIYWKHFVAFVAGKRTDRIRHEVKEEKKQQKKNQLAGFGFFFFFLPRPVIYTFSSGHATHKVPQGEKAHLLTVGIPFHSKVQWYISLEFHRQLD